MSEYLLDDNDVSRLKRLLSDFENGRLYAPVTSIETPQLPPIETYLAILAEEMPASNGLTAASCSANIMGVDGDNMLNPDVGFTDTVYSYFNVAIPFCSVVHLGREPYSGKYFVYTITGNTGCGSGSGSGSGPCICSPMPTVFFGCITVNHGGDDSCCHRLQFSASDYDDDGLPIGWIGLNHSDIITGSGCLTQRFRVDCNADTFSFSNGTDGCSFLFDAKSCSPFFASGSISTTAGDGSGACDYYYEFSESPIDASCCVGAGSGPGSGATACSCMPNTVTVTLTVRYGRCDCLDTFSIGLTKSIGHWLVHFDVCESTDEPWSIFLHCTDGEILAQLNDGTNSAETTLRMISCSPIHLQGEFENVKWAGCEEASIMRIDVTE